MGAYLVFPVSYYVNHDGSLSTRRKANRSSQSHSDSRTIMTSSGNNSPTLEHHFWLGYIYDHPESPQCFNAYISVHIMLICSQQVKTDLYLSKTNRKIDPSPVCNRKPDNLFTRLSYVKNGIAARPNRFIPYRPPRRNIAPLFSHVSKVE